MHSWQLYCAVGYLFVAPMLGILCSLMARLSVGSSWQAWCHRCFFACVLLMSGATFGAYFFDSVAALVCGITLALMVVTVVYDGGADERSQVEWS